ncbi:unnamed protein product [Closterium sp. Yama58-4]|nr:unnamed protein product [Closterium sp. Yama58-4]
MPRSTIPLTLTRLLHPSRPLPSPPLPPSPLVFPIPSQYSRVVVVREGTRGATPLDVSPPSMSVRSRVHEYGGGAFLVAPSPPPATSAATSDATSAATSSVAGDLLIFSNGADQRLYALEMPSDGSDSAEAPQPRPLTPVVEPPSALRFADGRLDVHRRRVICVQEDHRQSTSSGGGTEEHGGHGEPSNMIVAVSLDSDGTDVPVLLASGADFYASPRLSPDGKQLAWMEWSHPHMPWERSRIMVGAFDDDGCLTAVQCAAGADASVVEAPMEPLWSPQGELYFLSDRLTGFWALQRWNPTSGTAEAVADMPKHEGTDLLVEVGGPLWVFGNASYAFIPGSSHHVAVICQVKGQSQLGIIDTHTRSFTLTPPTHPPLTQMSHLVAGKDRLFVCAGGPSTPLSFFELKPSPDMTSLQVIHPAIRPSTTIDTASLAPFLSSPQWVEFPTTTPAQGEQSVASSTADAPHTAPHSSAPPRTAHALFYPPANSEYQGPQGALPPLLLKCHGGPTGCLDSALRLPLQFWTSRGFAVVDVNYGGSTVPERTRSVPIQGLQGALHPPLLVKCHGGPTGCLDSALRLPLQFWTSRGFAVVDVNYGGSTGYGREYRERLHGQWGVVDVDDACCCVEYLVRAGLVDGSRVAIDGSSAGGFTTLSALTFRSTFKAGCSLYGVRTAFIRSLSLIMLVKHHHPLNSHLPLYLQSWMLAPCTGEVAFESRLKILKVESESKQSLPAPPCVEQIGDLEALAQIGDLEAVAQMMHKKHWPIGTSCTIIIIQPLLPPVEQIGDLEALAQMMHKFEMHYTDTLVAPYNTPEGKQLYKERSPINHVDKLACPLLLLQGLKDQVVSPDQARAMHAAVKAKGLPVAIIEFPDEDHGFRNADNIKAALEMELEFFCRVLLNLPSSSDKQRLTIDNFDQEI